mgnify:CR=1 FL=1
MDKEGQEHGYLSALILQQRSVNKGVSAQKIFILILIFKLCCLYPIVCLYAADLQKYLVTFKIFLQYK